MLFCDVHCAAEGVMHDQGSQRKKKWSESWEEKGVRTRHQEVERQGSPGMEAGRSGE